MLITFGGLPGTGKTTVSRALAQRLGATYLRIDAIEQAIRDVGVLSGDIGPAGYVIAHAVAEANLALGKTVVADCVNPVAASRNGWRLIAARLGVHIIEVEVICSDKAMHRARVEGRTTDIVGLALPTWQMVLERRYDNWSEPHLVIDTAAPRPDEATAVIERSIEEAHSIGEPAGLKSLLLSNAARGDLNIPQRGNRFRRPPYGQA